MATSARDVARRVLARVEREGAWATLALDGELARSGLDPRDRRLAAELVYGVLRHRARLDRALAAYAELRRTPPAVLGALRVAAYQLLWLRVPAHAAVDDAVEAVRGQSGRLAGFANAVLRKLASQGEPPLPPEGRARLEAEHSLPGWIVDELQAALRSDGAVDDGALASAVAALAQPAPLWARSNPRRASRDEVAAALAEEGAAAEPGPGSDSALRLAGLGDPAASASFRRGLWTVQDLGAQRVGALAVPEVAPAPALAILDACAGVGGKSTHLAERTGDVAPVHAADISRSKLRLAEGAARRLGLVSVTPVVADLLEPTTALGDAYALIVLDAPCTGLGVLRRHPESKWRLVPDDVERMAALQARLLDAAAARLAPGGLLVYSVCTFTLAEGPRQAARLLERRPELVPEPAPGGVAAHHSWPHVDGADGFYAARFRRSGPRATPW